MFDATLASIDYHCRPSVSRPFSHEPSGMTLSARRLQPELMDAPDVEERAHRHALAGLGRINRFSLSSGILWPSLRESARRRQPHPLRVLDLASGGGDVLCGLARRAQRAGLHLEAHGIDRSPVAVDTARALAQRCGVDARFEVGDVLDGKWPERIDVVMCSLFLHHLPDDDVVRLLRRMREAATVAVLANDLLRSRVGYWLAWWGCRALTRSAIVHVDGPRSVEGAFTREEALGLARQAGLTGVRLTRHWPERFLLRWDQT
jgi:2-polyprenyl-3-methyl-5-hydroxy-6-metoxy-1,4-benzoquinol methylase